MSAVMTSNLSTVVIFFALTSSVLVLLSNYKRNVNRSFALGILLLGIWMGLRHLSGANPNEDSWFRACLSVGPLILAQFILCTGTISYGRSIPKEPALKLVLFVTLMLAIIPWHSSFSANTNGRFQNGIGFYLYIIINPICYILTLIILTRRARHLSGISKIELQTLTYPSIFLGVAVCLLMIGRAIAPALLPRASSAILVAIFISWLIHAFSTHKVLDAQYTFRIAARFAASAIVAAAFTILLSLIFPEAMSNILTAALAGICALVINFLLPRNVRISFLSLPELDLHKDKIFEIIQTASDERDLIHKLSESFCTWAKASVHIRLLEEPRAINDPLQLDGVATTYLQKIKWATPERLKRGNSSNEAAALLSFMSKQTICAIAVSNGKLPTIVALGRRLTGKPFTYPEIQQLLEFASLAELALIRARLSAQAVHADRLITIGILGASLAHEIRNPLFAIKAYAELLPSHYDRAEFRSEFAQMVNAEASRINDLLSDMMSLSRPRQKCISPTNVNAVIENTLELVSHKARCHEIFIKRSINASAVEIPTDGSFIRQVLLNLCINAIQVQSSTPHPRWIQVATTTSERGFEITVSDNGPGIAPHLRPNLFGRFQTASPGGTGLGLCISKELVSNLGGTLDVDPSVPGSGATFRVILPISHVPAGVPEIHKT